MSKRTSCAAVMAIALTAGMTVPAGRAQTTGPLPIAPETPMAGPGFAAEPKPGETVVVTVAGLELIELSPTSLTARLSPQLAARIGKNGDLVRLVGSSRASKSAAASQTLIGQIVWTGVQAEINNRRRQVPLDKPLTSAFAVRMSSLPAGTAIKAAGDIEGLIAAARRLFDLAVEDPRKADAEKQKRAPANSVGGGGSRNELAESYRPLPPPAVATKAPDLPVVTGLTRDGCAARVDAAQGVVIVQSRTETSQGGTITSQGPCTDSEIRYAIQKSYASCTDRIDVPARKALAQVRRFYADEEGRTIYLSDCVDDPENEFKLVEDAGNCTYDVDLAAMMAFARSELVYTNRQNQRVLVEACHRYATVGLPVSRTADGCTFRHDFQAKISYQQKRFVYTNPNHAVSIVAECSDDENELYPHVEIRNACANLVDEGAKRAFPQRRWRIVPPAGPLWISECEPVSAEGSDIVATVVGCESVYFHSVAAGQSFGAERHYYSFDGGATRTYITSCQQSTVAYPHISETQGYENHDPEKFAYARTAIYIDTPVGRVDVSPAQVREGAPQIAYIFSRQTIAAQPDRKFWEGCNAFVPTSLTDVFVRPDGSEALYAIGPGAISGPVDECARVTQTQSVYSQTRITLNTQGHLRLCNPSLPPCIEANGPALNLGAGWAGYTSCITGAGHAGAFVHMVQPQSRIATTYPNGVGTSYSAWSPTGAEQVAATYSCSGPADGGGS